MDSYERFTRYSLGSQIMRKLIGTPVQLAVGDSLAVATYCDRPWLRFCLAFKKAMQAPDVLPVECFEGNCHGRRQLSMCQPQAGRTWSKRVYLHKCENTKTVAGVENFLPIGSRLREPENKHRPLAWFHQPRLDFNGFCRSSSPISVVFDGYSRRIYQLDPIHRPSHMSC